MKRRKISQIVDGIDEKFLNEAVEYSQSRKRKPWAAISAIAACLMLTVGIGAAIVPMLDREPTGATEDSGVNYVYVGNLKRPYRRVAMRTDEMEFIYGWEYRTYPEKYSEFTRGEDIYVVMGRTVGEEFIGDKLDSVTVKGVDDSYREPKIYTEEFDMYSIKDIDSQLLVALKMGNEFYAYGRRSLNSLNSFGQLMDKLALKKSIKLEKFEYSADDKYYVLKSDAAIWELLDKCKDAPRATAADDIHKEKHISFSVTSERLGVYRKAFTVYESGYIITNIYWGDVFFIGETAAKQIIAYATANGSETEMEPYESTLYGNIVEIGEDYMVINDYKMCKDANDGIDFKLSMTDIHVKRATTVLTKGSFVKVTFDGRIAVEDGNLLGDVYNITQAFMSEASSDPQINSSEQHISTQASGGASPKATVTKIFE